MSYLLIFLGGGLGSIARFGIGKLITRIFSGSFPIGTLTANLLSCIVLGVVLILASRGKISESQRMLLVVGFCGGFSTFSSFSMENVQLLRNGEVFMAIANILISITTCITILWFLSRQTT